MWAPAGWMPHLPQLGVGRGEAVGSGEIVTTGVGVGVAVGVGVVEGVGETDGEGVGTTTESFLATCAGKEGVAVGTGLAVWLTDRSARGIAKRLWPLELLNPAIAEPASNNAPRNAIMRLITHKPLIRF